VIWRSLTNSSKGQLAVGACQELAPATPRRATKPSTMITQTLHSFTADSRQWFRLELSRLAQRAVDFKSFDMPLFEEPVESNAQPRQFTGRDPRIAPTAIVLLGLGEIIFVAFLVGQVYGGLHPVWKVIVGLASIGIAAFSIRLFLLATARCAAKSPAGDGTDWSE
jgi:hypothetical protein